MKNWKTWQKVLFWIGVAAFVLGLGVAGIILKIISDSPAW
jgi:hypothetical protein